MHFRRLLLAASTLAALGTIWSTRPVLARSAAQGSVRVVPYKVGIGRSATLIGSHLPANKIFTFMLQVPNANAPRVSQFVQTTKLPRSDGRGNLRMQFRMPIVPVCGAASIYVRVFGQAPAVRAPIVLTGCTPPKHVSVPPPPPVPKKKHK